MVCCRQITKNACTRKFVFLAGDNSVILWINTMYKQGLCQERRVPMKSIKQYAADNNVSYEAIRLMVKRYERDLEGHIVVDARRTRLLDDWAVEFLDEKRKRSPIVVYEKQRDERVAELEEENRMLHLKVEQLQDALIQSKDECNALLLSANESKDRLISAQDEASKTRENLSEVEADNLALREQLSVATTEVEQLKTEIEQLREKQQQPEEKKGFFARLFGY